MILVGYRGGGFPVGYRVLGLMVREVFGWFLGFVGFLRFLFFLGLLDIARLGFLSWFYSFCGGLVGFLVRFVWGRIYSEIFINKGSGSQKAAF